MENENFNVATKEKLSSAQLKNVETLNYANGNVKITKVLTANAKPSIETITREGGKIKLDGEVEYDVLAVLETGDITPITQKSNFSQTFEVENITDKDVIESKVSLIDFNNTNSGDNISYSSTLNFDLYKVANNTDVKIVTPEQNVFVKKKEFQTNCFEGQVEYDGHVSFDIAKDSKTNKILYTNSQAVLKSVIPATDYYVASGTVYTTIVFQSEDGTIKSVIKENNFSEEIEAVGITKESIIHAKIITKESVVVENNEKNIFNFDIPIKIITQYYNKKMVDVIVDAYSLQNEVNLTTTSTRQDEFYTTKFVEDNIITNSSLDPNLPNVDKVLAVVPGNILSFNQVVKDDKIYFEGMANVNVVYYSLNEEGNEVLNSLDLQLPYSLSFDCEGLTENDLIVSQITLGDVSVKNKMGKELEVLAEIKISYNASTPKVSAVVSDVIIGEEKPQKDYALEIYVARENQTLWDIAKELSVLEDDLIAQNKEISLPLQKGDKIVSYRQRVVDFE